MTWVPLHCHCAKGSVNDSILNIHDYVSKAKELGMPALALTDHGWLTGIYEFYNECNKQGIKPIVGCEIYVVDQELNEEGKKKREYNHLVLLVRTQEGLDNLLKIANASHTEFFYGKPLVPHKLLEQNGKGLIALSACVSGEIPKALNNDEETKAEEIAAFYKKCFDEFYLELQPGKFTEQVNANCKLVQLAQKMQLPLVVTNDIHYLNAEDAELHDWCVKLAFKLPLDSDFRYPDTCYYLMPKDEIKELFIYDEIVTPEIVEQALNNTLVVSEECSCKMDTAYKIPRFYDEDGPDEHQALAQMCYERLFIIKDTLDDPAKYAARLEYELDVIDKLHFSGYFLMVEDFISFARSNDIAVGPGRGSAGGALVSNLLGISPADPLKYNLMFERFLSSNRPGLPDIDVDYGSSRRNELKLYAVEKYGASHCAQVGTLGIRKARASIQAAGRLLKMNVQEVNAVAKLVPHVLYDEDGDKEEKITLVNSLDLVPELAMAQIRYPKLFDIALKLESLPCNNGVHAAGIIIAPSDLTSKLPLVRSKTLEGVNATCLDMADVEKQGYVKFDFLAISSIEVIEQTQRDVGVKFDYRANAFDDHKVWDLIGSNHTTGLFQLGSSTYKERMPRIKPKSIEQLAACLALLRGPCISSGADKVYMDIAEGKRQIEKIHPVYDEVTKGTNGILLYQEQLMQVAMNVGFSSEDSYKVMKGIAKKKMDVLRSFKEQFADGAKTKGLNEDQIEKIWSIFLSAGQYSFNTAHAVSYALLAYASAYMKAYYPLQYLTNLFSNAYDRGQENLYQDILDDCRRLNIEFLPADANYSDWKFKVEDGKIRIGLCAVKTFGESCWLEIKDKRPFADFHAYLSTTSKRQCNTGHTAAAIMAGMFDEFGNRLDLLEALYAEWSKPGSEPAEIKVGIEKIPVTATGKELERAFFSCPFFYDETKELKPAAFDKTDIGNDLVLEAIVRNIDYSMTKKKTKMAHVVLGTRCGTLKAVAFDSFISRYEQQLNGQKRIKLRVRKESPGSCVLRDVC